MTFQRQSKCSLSSFFHSHLSTSLFTYISHKPRGQFAHLSLQLPREHLLDKLSQACLRICLGHLKQQTAQLYCRINEEKIKHPLLIKPSFCYLAESPISFDCFIKHMTTSIHQILPKEIVEELQTATSARAIAETIKELNHLLPIISWSEPKTVPSIFTATLLCPAHFTQGVGRYFTDTLSRWLIPGKFLTVYSAQSLNFHFEISENNDFFIHQIIIQIEDNKELALIKNNLPSLAQEIKLNVHAVKHSRTILANKRLSPEQKRTLIEENLSSILDRPSKEIDSNVFDQMHHFLLKLSAEEKEAEIKKNFVVLMQEKPSLYDRDIFNEIRHFILLFRDKFTAMRTHEHIAKTISLLYLFRKALEPQIKEAPTKRHLELKFFKTKLISPRRQKTVLSLIIAVNIIQENELLDQRHILSAIDNILPNVKKVSDSFVVDSRTLNSLRLFYLEIEKKDGTAFSLKETKRLKKHLPRELNGRIENVIHPVVLTRNEEEVMRNIVMLSQELKYVHDIPQAYISFDTQVSQNLSFTVILLRLLHKKDSPIREILSLVQTPLSFFDFETKQVGLLRKKYPKEANVFRVELDKTPFLRRDFSLDLFKARLVVSEELTRIFGEIRDFNGGILSKQQEALFSLKRATSGLEKSNDFLLENFFYSITPAIGRSILYTSLLKGLYLMMLEALERDFIHENFWIKTERDKEYTLIMIASPYALFKDEILSVLSSFQFDSLDISSTYIDSNEVACLGIIHRCDDYKKNKRLHQTLLMTLSRIIPPVRQAEGTKPA